MRTLAKLKDIELETYLEDTQYRIWTQWISLSFLHQNKYMANWYFSSKTLCDKLVLFFKYFILEKWYFFFKDFMWQNTIYILYTSFKYHQPFPKMQLCKFSSDLK